MKRVVSLCFAVLVVSCCLAYVPLGPRKSGKRVLQLAKDVEGDANFDKVIGSEVNDILGELFQNVYSKRAVRDSADDASMGVAEVELKFKQIFSKIKDTNQLSETGRLTLYTEATLMMDDAKKGDDNAIQSLVASQSSMMTNNIIKTRIYSQKKSPVLVVHGPGPVGVALVSFTKSLGKEFKFQYLEADVINTTPESQLNFAVREARAIIIAADSKKVKTTKSGWFGGGSSVEPFVVNEKGIKRLLNAVMNLSNRSQDNYNVKVVVMDNATKESKGIASMIGGGASDLGSEVILQCQQRKLDYAVMKMGEIIKDSETFPVNTRLKSRKTEDKDSNTKVSIAFTRSRVESSEVTKVSVAVEALLRSASHPQSNSTISLVSIEPTNEMPTDEEWDDEFLRIDGPELERIPILYASELQIAIKIGRVVKELQESGKLITPIEIERYSNGVRVLFRPKEDSYISSKEEKNREAKEKKAEKVATTTKSGYISPEEEARSTKLANSDGRSLPPKKKIKQELEGGLEFLLDATPYRRVRIRRCNMDPKTIIKEESEAMIIKEVYTGIRGLEKMYEMLMTESK